MYQQTQDEHNRLVESECYIVLTVLQTSGIRHGLAPYNEQYIQGKRKNMSKSTAQKIYFQKPQKVKNHA